MPGPEEIPQRRVASGTVDAVFDQSAEPVRRESLQLARVGGDRRVHPGFFDGRWRIPTFRGAGRGKNRGYQQRQRGDPERGPHARAFSAVL